MKKLLTICVVAAFVLLEAEPLWPATLEVRPPGGIGTLGDVYTCIQDAIDDAEPGDTITVHDGTYIEDLVIHVANLTLKSTNGAAVTTIKGVANVDASEWPLAVPNIEIPAGGVEVNGFTIQGPNRVPDKYSSGMVIGGDNVDIHDNVFQVTNAYSLDEISQGIQTWRDGNNGAGDLDGLSIHGNTFEPWGSGTHGYEAIFINHTPSCPTPAAKVIIAGNHIGGEVIRGITTERSNVNITGNKIETTLDPFDGSVGAFQAILVQDFDGREVTDVKVKGNQISGFSGFSQGVRIGTSGQPLTNITVEDNTIQSSNVGIQVRSSAGGVAVNYNKITGNTTYGVENTDAATLDATLNWWGDVTGPYHPVDNPDGLGDEVSDNVDFIPWYANETMLEPVTVKVGDTEQVRAYCDTIQDGIDAAYEGDTIIVSAGTYPEYLHITKDGLTIEGAGIDQSIIDLDGLIPYWHYAGCSRSFASRAGVLITGYGSPDEIVENVTFTGFTVQNAGLNPPITATGQASVADPTGTVLTDGTATWTDDELVGQWVHNVSDKLVKIDISGNNPIRSYGLITANTATTVTATLAGGLDNDWDVGDTYVIMPYEEYVDVAEDLQDDITGISIQNGKDIAISYCKSINNGSAGIGGSYARCVSSAHKYSEGITIDHCTSSDNPRHGISIGKYVGAVTITNNTCSNNGSPHPTDPSRERTGVGITVSGLNSGNPISGLIFGNTCSNNGFEGIVLKDYSDGVTIEDNTVTGSNFDEDGAGIFFYGKSSTPANCKNNIIRNNTVTGNIRGICAYYAQGGTIVGNTITTDSGDFDSGQAAIKIDGGNNITVEDNIISCDGVGIRVTNTWNNVESYANTFTGNTITGAKFAGVRITNGAHDNTFTGNTITGTTVLTRGAGEEWEDTQGDGVFIDDDAGTGNVFNCNKIYDNAEYGMENQTATAVDATSNWWGDASGPGGVGGGLGDEVSANVDFFPWLLNDNIEECAELTEVVADFVVDDDWAPLPPFTQVFVGSTAYYIDLNAFDTIQEAVDAASDGNNISVADGNYVETLVIGKSVKVIGAGGETSIVQSSTGLKLISINAADTDVELAGFTLRHTGTDNWSSSYVMLIENGAYANIHDNVVDDFKKRGIYVMGSGSSADIVANTIIGEGEGSGLQNGIVVWNSGGGFTNIVNNEVSGGYYTGERWTATGIMALDTYDKDVLIAGNYVHDNQLGIAAGNYCEYTPGSYSADVTIRANRVEYNTYGIDIFNDIRGALVQGNYISASTEYAIGVSDYNDTMGPCEQPTDTIIQFNNIADNNVGMWVIDRVAPVNAEYNYWGDFSGPDDPCGTNETDGITCYDVSAMKNADGLGDGVTENADYCPWLTAPVSPSDDPYPPGDMDYDYDVDMFDFAILALHWLEGCE